MGLRPHKVPPLNYPPFFHQRGPVGCLLIHGFTGCPAEMELLGQYLAERNMTVSGIRLAGHGTHPDEMAKTGWRDWAESAEKGYEDLKSKCEEVFVAGLSMGGALTLYLAARHELPAAASFAGAAIVSDWRLKLLPLARKFIRFVPKGEDNDLYDKEAIKHIVCYEYVPLDCVISLVEFTSVVREGLPSVKCPIIIMHGLQDKTLPQASSQYIYEHVGSAEKELLWLEKSGHGIPVDHMKDLAFERTYALFRRHSRLQSTLPEK